MFNIERRQLLTYNNDPQRRCYNGAHFSTATCWSEWVLLEFEIPEGKIERRVEFWKELNSYAVSQRGESAVCEFRSVLSNTLNAN